jgi:hypothetical protein
MRVCKVCEDSEVGGGCVKCVRRVEWRVCEVCEESGVEGV